LLNRSLLRSYLVNHLLLSKYEIWFYTPIDDRWILLDSYGIQTNLPPSFIFDKSLPSKEDSLFFTFDYPQDYKVTITYEKNDKLDKENMEILYHLLYPFYTHLLMKRKGVELEKLIEGVQNITASLDIDELLVKILDNVAIIIPGANASIFWMYSPDIDRLVCKAYRGWKKEIENVRFKIGEAVTGKTYLDGKPRIYYSFREANEAMKGTSEVNFEYLKCAFHERRVKVTATIPIKFRDEIIGVLDIHQDDRERNLTEWDLQLLNGLSAQISIAIENARLFTEINRKNQVLMKQNEVHSTLLQLSLQNKGVKAITKELNDMLGLPIIFVDMLENELFPRLDWQPFSWDELARMATNRNVPTYVELFDDEEKSFYIYPILVGNACSGCLLIRIDRPLTQLEQNIVERGGSVLALELTKRKSLTEVYYKKTHDFYNELLLNDDPHLLHKKALDLGINLESYLFSVIVHIANFQDLQVLEAIVHRMVSRIKQRLSEVNKMVFGYHNKVTQLFSLTNPSNRSSVIQKLQTILKEFEQNDEIHLYVGVGSIYKGIESVAKSHNEANKAISYLLTRQKTGIIFYSDIGINRLFINQSPEEIENFLQEIFSPLNAEKVKNSELEKTLITYFKTNQSSAKTAEKLHIHTNTLYLRLKKIEELLEMSLEEPENILKVQLACHLRETYVFTSQPLSN
jgi:sugar diacid utilization regulator/putative methionine-R-sulfoxide reductase with GAF domain